MDITTKFNHSSSSKKNELIFIYKDFLNVEVLNQHYKTSCCEASINNMLSELHVPELQFPLSDKIGMMSLETDLMISDILSDRYDLVFGDFTSDECLYDDLFLTDESSDDQPPELILCEEIIVVEPSVIEEKLEKRVLFPISWNDMIENKRNSLKRTCDKSVVAIPSFFEEKTPEKMTTTSKKTFPFGFKDDDFEDISPDEDAFETPSPIKPTENQKIDVDEYSLKNKFSSNKKKNRKKRNASQSFYF